MAAPPITSGIPDGGEPTTTNPSSVARETLRQLAALRLPPTPENYGRMYQNIAHPGVRAAPTGAVAMLRDLAGDLQRAPDDPVEDASALLRAVDRNDWLKAKSLLLQLCVGRMPGDTPPRWAGLIGALMGWWEARTPALPQARKRELLEEILTAHAGSHQTLAATLEQLVQPGGAEGTIGEGSSPDDRVLPDAAPSPAVAYVIAADAATAAWTAHASQLCRSLLAEAILAGSEEYPEELAREAQTLAEAVRDAADEARLDAVAERVRAFSGSVTKLDHTQRDIQHGLLRLLQLLTANVSELLGDGSWMRGQLKAFAALSKGPVTIETIARLEAGLQEIAKRQGALKQSLDEAKDAMKQMVATFIERVGELASNTGEYHERLAGYAREIESASDIGKLSSVIVHVMDDTRGMQTDLSKSRDELLAARRTVEQFQERANRLETELVVLSDRLQEDQLTQVLNRRGLDRAFDNEAARADRYGRPMSLAMLDVDNFKSLNDRFGHQAGDSALVHLTASIRQSLRTTDVIARYGGEEFVILLPETARDDAMVVLVRVQRELTRRFFLHNNERVLITFSAGVAERTPGEVQEDLIERADRALYRAKLDGKNRVVAG